MRPSDERNVEGTMEEVFTWWRDESDERAPIEQLCERSVSPANVTRGS